MPRVALNIAQGFYVDESLPISSQQCVNLYPHTPQTKTITDGSLIGVSGISLAITAGLVNRGAFTIAGIAYFLNAQNIYVVNFTTDAFGVRTYNISYINPSILGSSKVVMADNGDQLCIVAPDVTTQFNAWIYSATLSSIVQISDADFNGPVSYVCYMDGYFIFAKANSNIFFISDLRDGMTYSALDFASAESDPDDIVALKPLNGLLYVFGSRTYEQWQNVGGSGFPLTKATSGSQQKGCTAPLSLAEFNGSLVWIGGGVNEKPSVWATKGGEPIKLSTPAVDVLINSGGLTLLAQAFQMNWAEKGHNFMAFTVPTVCTIVYDASTQSWHERKSLDSSLNQSPWRVSSLLSVYSVVLVGDETTGKIGVLSDEVFTEYDNTISSYFTCPSMDNNGDPFTVNSVELMMETGTCPISGAGSAPQIRMAVSSDGGRLFSPEISRLMGVTGAYEQRISWDLLGRYSRSFTPKFLIDEPIKRVIVKGEIVIGS
jgi:hypothetical protein